MSKNTPILGLQQHNFDHQGPTLTWLSHSLIKPPQQLQLPIYGVGGVQMQTVRIATDNPSASPCRRCVRAFASGDFGEVKQWSVWYDGARNWQPVFMQMRLGKSAEWVLTLSLNS